MKTNHVESRCENCIIRQLNSLQALKRDELKKISDAKETRHINKGDVIFSEGERLNGVYCVRNGISKLSKSNQNGKDQIIKFVKKGEVLGQRSVITKESTNLSATALKDMDVCFIPKSLIEESLETNPKFIESVLKNMSEQLRVAEDSFLNMAQKNVNQRLAEALLYVHENFGEDNEGYMSLILTRADYASVVGTATELCIRTLAKFKKHQIILTKGKRIKIIDKERLQLISEGLRDIDENG